MPQATELTELSWAGWTTAIPAAWRPLKIAGTWQQGVIVLGNSMQSVLQVSWQRPKRRRFDVERSMAAWRKRVVPKEGTPSEPGTGGDFPGGRAYRVDSGDGKGRFFWCGYAPQAGLVLELRSSARLAAEDIQTITDELLPHLTASEAGGPTRWAVFNSSFVSPAAFAYERHKLNVGNVGLCFRDPGGRRLVLRQVYPADLALQRRELADWLEDPLFKEKLVAMADGPACELSVDAPGEKLAGLVRTGWKCLPGLLRFVRRRAFMRAIVHDVKESRLRLTEFEGKGELDEGVVRTALAGMGCGRQVAEG